MILCKVLVFGFFLWFFSIFDVVLGGWETSQKCTLNQSGFASHLSAFKIIRYHTEH